MSLRFHQIQFSFMNQRVNLRLLSLKRKAVPMAPEGIGPPSLIFRWISGFVELFSSVENVYKGCPNLRSEFQG